ncbi:MAG TPA: amidohydrolase family protein [Candidatus Eisenbacteria bacterium]|nr:amidohydrolase family protein [Candidatus Eisenbacteria bacterium]
MQLKYGLISADSHAAFDRDTYTSRMSKTKWGDKIPHVVEVKENGERVDRWSVYGKISDVDVCNCPALMGEPFPTFPKRWDEVPKTAYEPLERLKALDLDGVDAEVLFPNPPGGTFFEFGDADFELDVVRAYNDALAAWARASERYWPLAIIPYLSEPGTIAREIERAAACGHKGINCLGEMPKPLPHLTDPRWYPVWDVCQQLELPVHIHGSAGLRAGASVRKWSGYTPRQAHSAMTATSAVTPAQIIPHLIFSGLTERFPRLKFVFAEAGIGGLNYVLAACDHEWETRRLWTEGLGTRPSETVRRQMYVNFWFEAEGIKLRHEIGIDNIMWESDFPHVASYYPHSWQEVERVLQGVPAEDRQKLLYVNALRLYGVEASAPEKAVQGAELRCS